MQSYQNLVEIWFTRNAVMMGPSVGRAMASCPGARKCSLGHYRVNIVAPASARPRRAAKTERFVQNYTIKVPAKILDLRLRPPPDHIHFHSVCTLWDSCASIFLGKAASHSWARQIRAEHRTRTDPENRPRSPRRYERQPPTRNAVEGAAPLEERDM